MGGAKGAVSQGTGHSQFAAGDSSEFVGGTVGKRNGDFSVEFVGGTVGASILGLLHSSRRFCASSGEFAGGAVDASIVGLLHSWRRFGGTLDAQILDLRHAPSTRGRL